MGVICVQRTADDHQDTLTIAKHLIVPKAQYPIALSLDYGSALLVGFKRMLAPVDLQHEPFPMACEVNNELPQRHLPPKLRLREVLSQ